jgi:RNA polymerase sigma-70 factor, ECF subfamily
MVETEPAAMQVSDETLAAPMPFEEFFELEQDRLLRVMWLVTGNLQEAEDIVQEAFIRVWDRWPEVVQMESPVGYVHRTAMNVFRNRYRRAKVALRKAIAATHDHDAIDQADDRIALGRALDALTARQRAAVVLTDALGYPAAEAGRMLGVRASTVRSLASTARASLRTGVRLDDD